mmetsp:Transcript_11333/g.22418  ORF Transcript_11333/g.22418 Transcript_11333/m.22418 type:complete len:292 (-) Transcript_11333:98-973(-)
MVRRFVQEEHVVLREEQPTEGHATLLSSREDGRLGISRRQPERIHGALHGPVQLPQVPRLDLCRHRLDPVHERRHPLVVQVRIREPRAQLSVLVQQRAGGGHGGIDALLDGRELQLGLLGEVADGGARQRPGDAVKFGVHPGHNFEERTLSGPVQPHEANLGPRVETQVDPLEDLFALVGQDLLQIGDGEHELPGLGVEPGVLHALLLLRTLLAAGAPALASAAAPASFFLFAVKGDERRRPGAAARRADEGRAAVHGGGRREGPDRMGGEGQGRPRNHGSEEKKEEERRG